MSTQVPPVVSRRRPVWVWVLGAIAIVSAPFVALAAVAASYVSLDSDARTLRQHVMQASGSDWNTKVQFSVGRGTLAAVRACLRVIDNERVTEARDCLDAVRFVSVGVYERGDSSDDLAIDELISKADPSMARRGWQRIVGVADGSDAVLIYAPDGSDDIGELCIAAFSGSELVVISAAINEEAVEKLVTRFAGEKIVRKLRARL